jgi:DNA-3-methyladenine glycosylase I
MERCGWPADDELMIAYHDTEWGVPQHDDQKLFEYIVLDAFQAGLSWRTILHRREGFRRAFADFDAARIARFTPKRVEKILTDPGIIRNRQKVESTVTNARAFLKIQEEHGSFDSLLWGFVDGVPKRNVWKTLKELPAKTPESDALSKELRARGFKFVGSTICYAFMQAAGLVNDHLVSCFRYNEV